jgi:amino acid permease
MYLIQFIIVPLAGSSDKWSNNSNENVAVLFIPTIAITLIGMFAFASKLRYWLLGLVLYALLIFAYSPPGAYGIGMRGTRLDGAQPIYHPEDRWFQITVILVFTALLQIVVWCFVKIILFLRKVLREKKA